MNPETSISTRISIILLCLPRDSCRLLLEHIQLKTARQMLAHLELLESLSYYDKEAALMDALEIVLREEQSSNISFEHRIRMLRFALDTNELPLLLRSISMDREESLRLLPLKDCKDKGRSAIRHILLVLEGIQKRLQDSSPDQGLVQDHFLTELNTGFLQQLHENPANVGEILEWVMLSQSERSSVKKNNSKQLSGRRKSAIALIQMEDEVLAMIMEHLARSEKQALAYEILCLHHIPNSDQLLALLEYMELLVNLKLVESDKTDLVQEVIEILRRDYLLSWDFVSLDEPNSEVLGSEQVELLDFESMLDTHLQSEAEAEYDTSSRSQLIDHSDYHEMRQYLLQAGLQATIRQPRLVARAIRYMFRQAAG